MFRSYCCIRGPTAAVRQTCKRDHVSWRVSRTRTSHGVIDLVSLPAHSPIATRALDVLSAISRTYAPTQCSGSSTLHWREIVCEHGAAWLAMA